MSRMLSVLCALAGALILAPAAAAADRVAPGAPGEPANWTPADKEGYGTAAGASSRVWHTLGDGELTEVYYPDLGTPSVRDLQLVVSDGRTFAERETDATDHRVELADQRSLTYRQIDTARSGRYRITKTYVTDPARDALLVDVRFESLTGKPYRVYALFDPALNNNGDDDSGNTKGGALLADDGKVGSALIAAPGFGRRSTGYLGKSDGWTDLRDDFRMDWHYKSSPNGNVFQTAGPRSTASATGACSSPSASERRAPTPSRPRERRSGAASPPSPRTTERAGTTTSPASSRAPVAPPRTAPSTTSRS
jgi:glucoamylase